MIRLLFPEPTEAPVKHTFRGSFRLEQPLQEAVFPRSDACPLLPFPPPLLQTVLSPPVLLLVTLSCSTSSRLSSDHLKDEKNYLVFQLHFSSPSIFLPFAPALHRPLYPPAAFLPIFLLPPASFVTWPLLHFTAPQRSIV